MIILLIGGKRSGKNALAAMLCKHYNLELVELAQPVKEIIMRQLGISLYELEAMKIDETRKIYGKTMREILQNTGEGMKEVFQDPLIWCKLAFQGIEDATHYLVSDVRLDMEAQYFRKGQETISIKIIGKDNDDEHHTENEWRNVPADIVVKNSYDGIEKFGRKVIDYVEEILPQL